MAENMCGPSNGAKNLVSHADRDRSLHQDRMIHRTPGSTSTFRTQQFTGRPGVDAAFNEFQSDFGGPAQYVANVPAMSAALGRMNLAGQPNQAVTYQPPAYPQYQRQAAGPVKSSANFAPAPASPLHIAAEDFKLFEASQLNRGNSSSANTNTMQISPSSNASQGIYGTNVNAPSPFGFATMNPLMNATMSSHWVSPMLSIQSTPQYATPAEQQTVQDLDSGVGISDAAFDAAFGAFDEGEFETELDKWMTEHGPTAERLQHAAGVPTAEEWAEIDKDLEQIAKETETRDGQLSVGHEPQQESQVLDGMTSKQTDENMKKAAADIIRSVADNDSAKFQKSSFFDLMRRIANAEVTVADNTFVDVETGAEVVTRPGDDVDPTDDYSSVPGGGLTENNGSAATAAAGNGAQEHV